MSELDLEVAAWLVSETGRASVERATHMLAENLEELAVLTQLRVNEPDPRRTAASLGAARCCLRARRRWVDADALLFTREALEQASDPAVSAWRAGRFESRDVVDLCASVGGDALAIAAVAASCTAVDLDAARLMLLQHNAAARGLRIPTIVGDALQPEPWEHLLPDGHVVHVDPARRVDGRRIADPTRTRPPVDRLVARYSRRAGLGVVLAPGTDADHPALGNDVEVEYIQLGDDLVEAVAWYGSLRDGAARASATVLPRSAPAREGSDAPQRRTVAATEGAAAQPAHRSRAGTRRAELEVGPIGDHLVEVAVAAIRARLHDDIGGEIGARRVAHRRAMLTMDGEPPASPWYRVRPVLAVLPARPGPIRTWLAGSDAAPIEVALHGVDLDPITFWRQIGRPRRGPGGIRIELVRRDGDQVAVVTRDVPRGQGSG